MCGLRQRREALDRIDAGAARDRFRAPRRRAQQAALHLDF